MALKPGVAPWPPRFSMDRRFSHARGHRFDPGTLYRAEDSLNARLLGLTD
jgi:hypothetical protein